MLTVGNRNAAFQQHFLDHTEAQREPIIQPDSVRDDLGGETMALVTGRYGLHGCQLISQKTASSLT